MRRFIVLIAVFALMAVPVFGATYGTIRVTVTDTSGAALPGATVEATSPGLIGTRTEVTDASGSVNVAGLPPGRYTLNVSLAGMQTRTMTVNVSADKTSEVTTQLAMAGVAESITVTAEAPLVETNRATISDEVTLEQVESLPVSRDYRAYAQLVAGVNVVPNQGGADVAVDPAGKGGNNYRDRTAEGRTGGTGSRDNQYYLDGLIITDIYSGEGSMTFNNEVILEQQVITSGVPAEFAGGKGFVGNIVTKSGGNDFSGSINYYTMSPNFYSDFKSQDTRLATALEDKNDYAATLGGPIWRDRAWFFLSGQIRENSDEVQLSSSASPNGGTVQYLNERKNYFGKLTMKPTESTTLIGQYFEDPRETNGSTDPNLPPARYNTIESTPRTIWGSLQHIFGSAFLVDGRVGRMEWDYFSGAANSAAGPLNDVLYIPVSKGGPSVPSYETKLGGSATSFKQRQQRDQMELSGTYFLNAFGSHALKVGFERHKLQDLTESNLTHGMQFESIAKQYAGSNWAFIKDNISQTDYAYIYGKLSKDKNSAAFRFADTNGDGILSEAEFAAIQFTSTAGNPNGQVNFFRDFIVQSGANNVQQDYNVMYVQDDWTINSFAVNLGARIEDLKYIASDGSTIVDMDPTVAPRLGLTYDIGGQGRQKISAFYGRYYDPIRMDMAHFAGNISGRVLDEQVFIGNDWYTFRTRGSKERRDAGFAPNIETPYQDEYSLTYGINLTPSIGFTAQAYRRSDKNMVEDYDPSLYIGNPDAEALGLGLTNATFGYGPEGPGQVNYFLANLIGAEREHTGLDLSLDKRFADRWAAGLQYSWRRGEGNTSSDANADFQGDLLELDPRQPYMNGRLPGTVPHSVKLFGSYMTPFNIEVGTLIYWSAGAYYTQGERAYGIVIPADINPDPNVTEFAKMGAEQHPNWYSMDLKFRYQLGLMRSAGVDLFFDVYNVMNRQDAIYQEIVVNDPEYAYGEVRSVLEPRRFQVGARLRF